MMTCSPPSSTYDDDFFVWTQEQAAALRRADPLAVGRDVDIEHIAEEIEDLGKRDLREVRCFLRLVFTHFLKIAASPNAPSVVRWRAEVRTFRRSAIDAFTPGMRQLLDLDALWDEACQVTREDLHDRGLELSAPATSPLTLDAVLSKKFDLVH